MILTALNLKNHSLKTELDLQVSLENSSPPQVFHYQTGPQMCRPISRRLEEDAVELPPTHQSFFLASILTELKSLESAYKYSICSDFFARQWVSHHLPTTVD